MHSFTHKTVQPLWRHCWRILNCGFHFYRVTHQNPIWLVWEWYCSAKVNLKRDSRTFYLFCLEPYLRDFVIQTFFNVTHWYDSCVTNYDNDWRKSFFATFMHCVLGRTPLLLKFQSKHFIIKRNTNMSKCMSAKHNSIVRKCYCHPNDVTLQHSCQSNILNLISLNQEYILKKIQFILFFALTMHKDFYELVVVS